MINKINQCKTEEELSEWVIAKKNKLMKKMKFCQESVLMDFHNDLNEIQTKASNQYKKIKSQQIKKDDGVSLQNHLETRSKAGEDNKRTMSVDVDNQSADTKTKKGLGRSYGY